MNVELRECDGETTRVRIYVGDKRFDITESFGKLNILSSGILSITPGVSNVIEIDCEEE